VGSPTPKWEEYQKAQQARIKKVWGGKSKNALWAKKLHRERFETEKSWLAQLDEGTLDIPHLGLGEVPESIFTFSPPLRVLMGLREKKLLSFQHFLLKFQLF
jgi:hypothetical protein